MSTYQVVHFSFCTGCNTNFINYSTLKPDCILKNHHLLDGNVIKCNLKEFIMETNSQSCVCHKTGSIFRFINLDTGVIIKREDNIIKELYDMEQEEFKKHAKRLLLQQEWKKELETNEEYKCTKCNQFFYQPLKDDFDKVCPGCNSKRRRRGKDTDERKE